MPLALANVRFDGKNGDEAVVTPFPLMTQSRHRQRKHAIEGVGYRLTRGLDSQFQRASEALRLEVKMSSA